jgi:hypothetical protein
VIVRRRERRSTRSHRGLGAAVLTTGLLLAGGVSPAAAGANRAPLTQPLNAHSVSVSVLDVTPTTPSSATTPRPITVTLSLTNNTDQTLAPVRIEGSRGDPISTREALDNAITQQRAPSPDLVGRFDTPKPVTTDLPPRATVTVTYASTSSSLSNDPKTGLCICQDRIYPLYFAVHATDISGADIVVGSGQTFVPAFGDPAHHPPVRVSWLWPLIDQPHRLVSDTTFLDDDLAYSVSGGRLDRALRVVELVAAAKPVAMTLVVDPELLDELAVMAGGNYTVVTNGKATKGTGTLAARDWLGRLRAVLTTDPNLELQLLPLADPDVESVVSNGLGWSTQLPPTVESRLSAALGAHQTANTLAWPVNGQVGTDTLDQLVRAGASSVVVADTSLSGAVGHFATSQLATLQTAAGQVTADVTQRSIQQYVAGAISIGSDAGTALLPRLVSEVAVSAIESPNAPTYVVIVPPRQVNAEPESAARAITETELAPWASSVGITTAAHQITPSDFGQLLPTQRPAGLPAENIATARAAGSAVTALTTMFSPGDASRLLAPLPIAAQRTESSAWVLAPSDGRAYAEQLDASIDQLESGVRIVRPATGTYTLASSSSPLPVTVENTLGVAVTVGVVVTSVNGVPGFRATPIQRQTIAPNTKVTLHVPTHVDRAGRFPVEAVLLTPSGVHIGQPVEVSVHSTALGVIGVVNTIVAAVVLVLALLFRLVRRMRRGPVVRPRTAVQL